MLSLHPHAKPMSSAFGFKFPLHDPPSSHVKRVGHACCPFSIHHRLLSFSLTHYSLNTHRGDAPDDELGLGPVIKICPFFCFILSVSLCLAAPLKSSPPRHMYVHGHRVHPSPLPPHYGTRCAVLLKSLPLPLLLYRTQACGRRVHLHFMGVRHRRYPVTARKTRHDATPLCHHNTATMPCEILL
ncbi:hypothetical protein EDB85DRAFT_1387681 [Lactarius pseudohatsudake]|nr:hypothetical protein EDB85DRAFT_1387681 [Lactarius pseudohatsudake]